MMYSAWGKEEPEGTEFAVVPGTDPPAHSATGLQLLKVFEATSWDDAMRQYHEWQGWEPYKPMLETEEGEQGESGPERLSD